MSEKPQQQPPGTPQPRPCAGSWKTTAIGILVAVVIGLIMILIGSARVRRGEQMKREAESRLLVAFDWAVAQAASEAKAVDDALLKNNWGDAARLVGQLAGTVSLMEQVTPEPRRGEVRKVTETLSQLQQAVGDQSREARDKLDQLRSAIASLQEAG